MSERFTIRVGSPPFERYADEAAGGLLHQRVQWNVEFVGDGFSITPKSMHATIVGARVVDEGRALELDVQPEEPE